jgi:hypothetical protein
MDSSVGADFVNGLDDRPFAQLGFQKIGNIAEDCCSTYAF